MQFLTKKEASAIGVDNNFLLIDGGPYLYIHFLYFYVDFHAVVLCVPL
jgi:hypothetical protein